MPRVIPVLLQPSTQWKTFQSLRRHRVLAITLKGQQQKEDETQLFYHPAKVGANSGELESKYEWEWEWKAKSVWIPLGIKRAAWEMECES